MLRRRRARSRGRVREVRRVGLLQEAIRVEADLPEEGILGADDRLVEGILVGAIRAGEDLPEEGTQVVDDRLVEGILAGEGLLVEAILGVDRLGEGRRRDPIRRGRFLGVRQAGGDRR